MKDWKTTISGALLAGLNATIGHDWPHLAISFAIAVLGYFAKDPGTANGAVAPPSPKDPDGRAKPVS